MNEDLAITTKAQIAIINSKIERDNQFIIITSKKLKRLNTIDSDLFLTDEGEVEKKNLLIQLDNLLNDELASDADFIAAISSTSIEGSLKEDYVTYRNNLINLITEKTDNYNALNDLLNKSNFYIKTIQLLLIENPVSWLITVLICLIFLLPIYFKYKVRDLSSRLFNKNLNNQSEIKRLREELIHTNDYRWLENKIKSINISSINTSDYYFQRMLIEHKIILEEYDETKRKFSEILTSNIKRYNKNSLHSLLHLQEKLKTINLLKYNTMSQRISAEYKNELMIKYEYWLDSPFRTKRKNTATSISNNEESLLDFIYNQEL